jgi:hypothetical protein
MLNYDRSVFVTAEGKLCAQRIGSNEGQTNNSGMTEGKSSCEVFPRFANPTNHILTQTKK